MLPRIATTSAIIDPRHIDGSAERFTKHGGRTFTRAGVAVPRYAPTTDFADHADALAASCTDLIGAPLARYYQVAPEDLIVIHDDLDLAAGKLRLRKNGSSGGQNGIKSIIERLGTPEFARVKVGIGRPPGRMDPAAYVLQDFGKDEMPLMLEAYDRAVDAIEVWLRDGIELAMSRFNGPAAG
mgnify:CR=1 FL=1